MNVARRVSSPITKQVSRSVTVLGGGGSNLTAGFSRDILTPIAGQVVTFTNTSSGAVSYSWDFGDGTIPDTATNPTHVFVGNGPYTVTLTVTSASGSTATATASISPTSPSANANLTQVNLETFAASRSSGSLGTFNSWQGTGVTRTGPVGAKLAPTSGVGWSGYAGNANWVGFWDTINLYTSGFRQIGAWFYLEAYPANSNWLLPVLWPTQGTFDGAQLYSDGTIKTTYPTTVTLKSGVPLRKWFYFAMAAGGQATLGGARVKAAYIYKELGGSLEILDTDNMIGTFGIGNQTASLGVGDWNAGGNQSCGLRVSYAQMHSLSSLANIGYPNDVVPPQDRCHIYKAAATGNDANDGVSAPWQTVGKLNDMLGPVHNGIFYDGVDGSEGSGNIIEIDTSSQLFDVGVVGIQLRKKHVWLRPKTGQAYAEIKPWVQINTGDWTFVGSGVYSAPCDQIDGCLWQNDVFHEVAVSRGALAGLADGASFVSQTISNATNASPIVITANSHGFTNGEQVVVTGVGGNTAANGTFTIGSVTANTFALVGSTGNGAYTSGGAFTGGKIFVKPFGGTDPRVDGKTYVRSRLRPDYVGDTVGLPAIAIAARDIRVSGIKSRYTAFNNNGNYVIGDITGFSSKALIENCDLKYGDKHLICFTINAVGSTIRIKNVDCEQGIQHPYTSYMGTGSGNVHVYENCDMTKGSLVNRSSAGGSKGLGFYSHGGGAGLYDLVHLLNCNLADNSLGSEGATNLLKFTGTTVGAISSVGNNEIVNSTLKGIPVLGETGKTTTITSSTIQPINDFNSILKLLGGSVSITGTNIDLTQFNGLSSSSVWANGNALALTFTTNTVRYNAASVCPLFENMGPANIATCDYNTYYFPAGAIFAKNFNGSDRTFAQWQSLGYDTHSTRFDP